jgi:glycerol uptake facilitator-like aquaporin
LISLSRRVVVEATGTAALVVAVVGSGIMAQRLTDDVALALLANALATGAALVVLVAVLGPLSGAHLNPVVTLVAALRRDLPFREASLFVLGQILGGVLGTLLAHAMFELPAVAWSQHVRSGPGQWIAEMVATSGLVAVVLIGGRLRSEAIPWLVGLYITSAYWFTASTSFANPAVTLARTLTDTFSGIRLLDAPGFIAAQCVGALVALLVSRWLLAEGAQRDRRHSQ